MSSSPPPTHTLQPSTSTLNSSKNVQKIDSTELSKSSSTTTTTTSNGMIPIMNNKMIEHDENSLLNDNNDDDIVVNDNQTSSNDDVDDVDDHYPGIDQEELSTNSLTENYEEEDDNIDNDDDDDDDRCTVISVPVGNINLSTTTTTTTTTTTSTTTTKSNNIGSNLLSMQTFVTIHNNNNNHKTNKNCDQENHIIDDNNDDRNGGNGDEDADRTLQSNRNGDGDCEDDDDDDDADRTLKSNRKIPDPNDRFYHHHPHYNNNNNNRFRIKKNVKHFIDININNDNDNCGDDDDDDIVYNNDMIIQQQQQQQQYQSYPNNLKQKMTTFMINNNNNNGPISTSSTTTKSNIAANINNNDNENLQIINGDLSTSSSSSTSLMATSSSTIQQPNTPPIFTDSNITTSTDSSTISSLLMPTTEQLSSSSSSTIATATTTTTSISISSPQSSTTIDSMSSSSFENNDTTTTTTTTASSLSSSSIINVNHSNHQSFGEPFVIMTKKENSCHFIERRISLAKQAKVGRSIGKTLASLNNAVFDCKVLSRNHAVLWYEEGKFYLKDTCSSNGTFVNGQRLSATNERSLPQVIYSGDCIQFGVEVTEKKNVHSCVIATVRLFHPDGTEATKDNHRLLADGCFGDGEQQFLLNYPNSSIQIPPSQLFDLVCQINQSVRKQTLLEQQLDSTRQAMNEALDSAKNGWRSLVEEDRFLSRIQTLQAQLEVCLIAKNRDSPESSIIEALKLNNLKLIADKEKFEQESKCSLQKALENKIITETNLQTAKTKLNAKIDECRLLQESLDSNVKELKCLAQNCDKLKKEKEELIIKVKRFEDEDLKLKQQKLNTTVGGSQQVITVKKSTTSTNTIPPIMLDQDVQTTIDNIIERISENHQQTQTDYLNESTDFIDSISTEPKQDEQIKSFILNRHELVENHIQPMLNRLSLIKDSVDKQLILMNEKQLNINKIFKNLQRKIQEYSILFQQNKSLKDQIVRQIENANKLKCDIQCLRIQLEESSNNKHKHSTTTTTANKSDNPVIKLEKSVQVEQQQFERKLLMTTTTTTTQTDNQDSQQQSTLSSSSALSSKMLLLKNLTMAIDNNDDDDNKDETIDEQQIDCDKIDKIIEEKMSKLIEQNQTLMANNEYLNEAIKSLKEKHELLSLQNQVSFSIAVLPLFVIFVCLVLALYQPLSFIMATFGL